MRILLTEIAAVEHLMPLATEDCHRYGDCVNVCADVFNGLSCVRFFAMGACRRPSVVYYPSVLADLPLCVDCGRLVGSGGRRKS